MSKAIYHLTKNKMYKYKWKQGFLYPNPVFDDKFQMIFEWELATIVAEANSWKTTFALEMMNRNAEMWIKWYYINLEFPIETTYERSWLWYHNKEKSDLSTNKPLTPEEQADLERYVNAQLKKYDYLSEPRGISLENLIKYIEIKALEWYKLFVVDTFSRIRWNLEKDARNSQNKCMEELQELAQRLSVAIVMLHHTNRAGTREGSQKIMDLSNVFIVIERDYDGTGEPLTKYKLMKDKYTANAELSLYYRNWRYEEF